MLPDLTAEAERALTTYRAETLQYAPRPGLPNSARALSSQMAADGIAATRENVLVTNGAKHAIDLICRVLLDEGDAIVVTTTDVLHRDPDLPQLRRAVHRGRPGSRRSRRRRAHRAARASASETDSRRRSSSTTSRIFTIPPASPCRWSVARRSSSSRPNAAFTSIEDSPYRKVRFEGDEPPVAQGARYDDTVVYVGTFSKLMAPGLRVGWAVASPDMIARMVQLKSDGGSCPLTQRIIAEFLGGGRLPQHIERVQTTYRQNRDAMVAALRRETA